MANLATLWIGDRLGLIEQASARSFLAHGDSLTIYTYGPVQNIPEGVHTRDANEILPTQRILEKSKSPALHSDIFRYQMVGKTNEIWVDLDIIALRPFEFSTEYIIGFQSENSINGAVFHLPQNSPTLKTLLEFTPNHTGMPPGLSGFRKTRYYIKNLLSGGLTLEQWPWGSLGPAIITDLMIRNNEAQYALPIHSFYPVSHQQAEKILIPKALQLTDIEKNSWAIHLWANKIKRLIKENYNGQVEKHSLLDQIIIRYIINQPHSRVT